VSLKAVKPSSSSLRGRMFFLGKQLAEQI
jgi:hypothetical protein